MKRKIKKRKNNKLNIPIILPILVIISILCLSIGFSAFQENMLVSDTVADIRLKKDIRVTGVEQSEATSDAYSNDLDYNNSNISGMVNLPYIDSSVTFAVEITNIENAEMGIYDLTIDNSNLDWIIESGYTKGDKLCADNNSSKCNLGAVSTIYITVFYNENVNNPLQEDQNFVIDFDFRGFYSITYNKITGTYQSEIMSGKTLNVDFGANALSNVKVTMGGVTLSTSDYTYTNGVINIPNVSDDVVIGPKETDESCFVSTLRGQINDYICEDTDVIIPEGLALKVNGSGNPISITIIGINAFKDKGLTSIVIPEGITSIRNNAFRNNYLTSINLPSSVTTIQSYTFENNLLEELTIPSSVNTIDNNAFQNNHIVNLILPNNMTTIPNFCFDNNYLETINIPNTVTSIGTGAFRNNRLSELIIPSSVTTIQSYAFQYNYIEDLVIPDTVISIGNLSFSRNLLSSLSIGTGITTFTRTMQIKNRP